MSDNNVRQFIAMPLGQGYTAEEQFTGKAEFGGIQIIVYPMKKEKYLKPKEMMKLYCIRATMDCSTMGIAAGGRIKQEIYEDEYGYEVWDKNISNRCFINIANSEQWTQITNTLPPNNPMTAEDYSAQGLPWFDYYSDNKVLKNEGLLSKLKGVASLWLDKKGTTLPNNHSIKEIKVKPIGKRTISDGDWHN